jgi:DNA mismatch repair ATPase MutS
MLQTKSKFIIATHFHQLNDIFKKHENISINHLRVDINANGIVYHRTLLPGACEPIYGLAIAKHIINDTSFNMIVDKYHVYNDFISNKSSRYNHKKFVTECEKCGSRRALETHHAKYEQKESLIDGSIKEKKYLNKNMKWNLQILCKECHNKITYSN